jgi:hypothetical protein
MKVLIDKDWTEEDAREITNMCYLLENVSMNLDINQHDDEVNYIKIDGSILGLPNIIIYIHPSDNTTENHVGEKLIFGTQVFYKNSDGTEKYVYKYGIHVLVTNEERSYYIYHPSM